MRRPRFFLSSTLLCLVWLEPAPALAQAPSAPTEPAQPRASEPPSAPPEAQGAPPGPSESQPAPAEPAPPEPATAADPGSAPAPLAALPEPAAPSTSSTSLRPAVADQAEITVVGTRVARTPGSAHVISRRQLERYHYDDPLAVVRTVPGVYVRTEDGMGLRPNIGLRGANSDRSKKAALMEDGVPFAPAPYSAPAAYYFPMITRMTQVRVIKGPAAISYGPQTVGGALDLVTRPIPDGASGRVELGAGQYGYRKFHGFYGWSDEQTGFLIEGVHLGSTGFKELPDGADTGFYRNEWMLKTARVLDPAAKVRNELRLKLTYSEEASNESYLGLSDADFRANPRRRYAASALDHMRWHRTAIVAEHELRPTPGIQITTSAYRNDYSRVWRKLNAFRGKSVFDLLQDPASAQNAVFYSVLRGQQDSSTPAETLLIGPNARDFVSQGVQTRVRIDAQGPLFAHRIEYGLRLHYDRIERRHSEDGFLMVAGELIPEGSPTVVTAFNEAFTESLAMNVSDAITWRALTVTPGVRVELMRSALMDKAAGARSAGSAQLLLPGIGAYQGLTDELGVLAGVYRGASPPPPGNPDSQRPELSVNYEAGIRHTQSRARAELIGFYNDYQNLTDVCTLSSGCLDADLDRQYDAGSARIYGLEAYFEREFPLGGLTLPVNASYTFTRAQFSRSFVSDDPVFGTVREDDDMPYVPRHQLNGTLGLESEYIAGHVTATYVSRMRERAGSGDFDEALSTEEEFVVDLGASHQPFESLEVYVSVKNVFDAQPLVSRRPYGARPIAPRWAQVGAKLSF